jgi:hypothetical protein
MSNCYHVRGCIQNFPAWPPGARTANGTALCYQVQLYRYFVSQSSEYWRHKPFRCFSTSVYCCKRIFCYRLSPETFGYTLVYMFTVYKCIYKVPKQRNDLSATLNIHNQVCTRAYCTHLCPRENPATPRIETTVVHSVASHLKSHSVHSIRSSNMTSHHVNTSTISNFRVLKMRSSVNSMWREF